MFQTYFRAMDFTDLPLFGLLLFGTMFALILLRTFGFSRRGDYEAAAALPLDDGRRFSRTAASEARTEPGVRRASSARREEGARWWHATDEQRRDAKPSAPRATGAIRRRSANSSEVRR